MAEIIQVVTTTSSRQEAEKIAEALVARRLAACVQVAGPVTSTYHWHGKIESGQEWQCFIKTRASHYREVERAIRQLHSYEVPEILAFEVTMASRSYMDWVSAEVADLSGPEII